MPRRTGAPGRPCDHVVGDFLTGRVRKDAPAGVTELIAAARTLRAVLDDQGLSVLAFSGAAGLDRSTVTDFLTGRVFVDTHTLARLERAAGVALWQPGGDSTI